MPSRALLSSCDNIVLVVAKGLRPSARRELEITDVLREYPELGTLQVELPGRGSAWIDTRTQGALPQPSNLVQVIESVTASRSAASRKGSSKRRIEVRVEERLSEFDASPELPLPRIVTS